MTSEQAFEILGIRDRTHLDEASLKRAFYAAARKTHPDSNPNDAEAEEKFQKINEAYAVLSEHLKFEKKKADSARQSKKKKEAAQAAYNTWKKAAKKKAASDAQKRRSESETGPDVWTAYNEADIKYAKQRHDDASERATETIRNHVRREREKVIREARERIEREQERQRQEEREKKAREDAIKWIEKEIEARQRAGYEQKKIEKRTSFTEWLLGVWEVFFSFWKRHIASNDILKSCARWVLTVILLVWAAAVLLGAAGGIADLTQLLAIFAKWILIVWISGKITVTVHKNWRNRILSTFAFMVSMELLIIMMNGLEDMVRTFAALSLIP